MKIAEIRNYTYNAQKKVSLNNHNDYSRNKLFIPQNDSFQKSKPIINFTANPASLLEKRLHTITSSSKIKSKKEFRELARNRVIHCFYCQKPVFSQDFVDELNIRGVFDGSIENFVKELAPYKSYLKPTSYDIFKYIEETAKLAPQTHLSRALQILNEDAIQDLRQKQLPIFKQIENEFQQLPAGIPEKVLQVLKTHKNRLKGIPQIEEFSPKDFSYKIKKASETVVKNIHRTPLSNYADTMLATTQTKYKNIYDNNIINKTFQNNNTLDYRMPVNIQGMQLYIVEQIKKIGIKTGRNDILTTCKTAEDMLLGKPVKIKFSNKAFCHDLEKVLTDYSNNSIKKRIFKTVEKLPTSTNNMNSFIAKHEFSSSATIGYELLKPSITTLEHMQPESTKGPYVNHLGNFAHACGPCNHKRSSGDMAVYLEKFPKTSPQVYFNDMIGVVNDGFISLEDILRMKETIYRQSGRKMNISTLSTNILQENFPPDKAQEKFDFFIELANNYLISGRDVLWLQQELRKRCNLAVKLHDLKFIFY